MRGLEAAKEAVAHGSGDGSVPCWWEVGLYDQGVKFDTVVIRSRTQATVCRKTAKKAGEERMLPRCPCARKLQEANAAKSDRMRGLRK